MPISIPFTFSPGTTIQSAQVNSNFSTLGSNTLNRTGDSMTGTLTTQAIAAGTDASYDIGTSGTKFRAAFFSGGLTAATLTLSGAITGLTNLTMSGALSGATTGSFSSTLTANAVTSTVSVTTTTVTCTTINASGTVTGNLFSGSGASLTTLPANQLSSGTVPTARLGSGSPDATTFLRGDQSWAPTWTSITSSSTGTQNDFAPGLVGNTILYCTNASLMTITGFAGGVNGQYLWVISASTGQVDLSSTDSGSGTSNQMVLWATSGKTSLAPGVGTALLVYRSASSKWILLAHEQGEFLEYGPTSTITGWASRTNTNIRYYLRGRHLSVFVNLQGTSNATTISFTMPYTVASGMDAAIQIADSGSTATTPGMLQWASGNTINAFKDWGGVNPWTNSGSKTIIGSGLVTVT